MKTGVALDLKRITAEVAARHGMLVSQDDPAMMLYIDHKCTTQPAFRKTFLVFTLIFVLLLWSPWRPLLCPVLGVCPAPAVRADTASQAKPIHHLANHRKSISPSPDQVPAEPSDQVAVQP